MLFKRQLSGDRLKKPTLWMIIGISRRSQVLVANETFVEALHQHKWLHKRISKSESRPVDKVGSEEDRAAVLSAECVQVPSKGFNTVSSLQYTLQGAQDVSWCKVAKIVRIGQRRHARRTCL